jgi:hypothetical protein
MSGKGLREVCRNCFNTKDRVDTRGRRMENNRDKKGQ